MSHRGLHFAAMPIGVPDPAPGIIIIRISIK